MPKIRGVLFDKDGTLFDFNLTWVRWIRAFITDLAGEDVLLAAKLGWAIGFDIDRMEFMPGSLFATHTSVGIVDALQEHLPGHTQAELLDRLNAVAASAPVCEAVPLSLFLNVLRKQGLVLGIASNDALDPIYAQLDQVGITPFFDFIAGFDSGYGSKPGTGMLRAFAEKMGLAPNEVLMVGDGVHDMMAARAAGMRAAAVLTGPTPREDLAPLADIVVPDIGYLPEWLAGRGASESVA